VTQINKSTIFKEFFKITSSLLFNSFKLIFNLKKTTT
jgi:hypothetical protein